MKAQDSGQPRNGNGGGRPSGQEPAAGRRSPAADFVVAMVMGFFAEALWSVLMMGLPEFVGSFYPVPGSVVLVIVSVTVPLIAALYIGGRYAAVRWGAITGILVWIVLGFPFVRR